MNNIDTLGKTITQNLFGQVLGSGNTKERPDSRVFTNLLRSKATADNRLGALQSIGSLSQQFIQPLLHKSDNPVFAGAGIFTSLLPIAVKGAQLAAKPDYGLLPDPLKTFSSWLNFAMNRGAGEIANGWVGAFIGSAGNDRISPSSLASFAFGGKGNDVIQGNAGFLLAHGGSGHDTLAGANGIGNILLGGQGNDKLYGGTALFNALLGGSGEDTLVGGTSLFGYANGGAGNDIVIGGSYVDAPDWQDIF